MYSNILGVRRVAVCGASRDPRKFGNIVYRFLARAGYEVAAVNPNADCIEDAACYASILEMPEPPELLVTVTQPWVTSGILKQCLELKVPYVWMQPGSEPRQGIEEAVLAGVQVVHGGPCIMVEFNRRASA